MRAENTIAVIIPVLNEEASIAAVLNDIPVWVDDIIVVDNGSTDRTAEFAAEKGARVILEPERGYGAACLRGIDALENPDIVVFLDGDYSDHPDEMALLVDPLIHEGVDMMIGSRARGDREPGALTPQAIFGNWLATRLIRLFWGIRYTDLGPFRAIRYRTLLQLDMRDRDYGWTVEMQIKAALHNVPADEAAVSYRKRQGVSKISGTVRGVLGAGYKILSTIMLSALFARPVLKTGLLIFYSRYPEPGTTKTRLIPALGPEGAAMLQQEMTEHTVFGAQPPLKDVDTQVCYEGGDERLMRAWLGPECLYVPQGEGDLGARMAQSFEDAFTQAYGKVVLCGTDCPALHSARTMAAFEALDHHDLVLGPATDGGYYLIGMALNGAPVEIEALFEGVHWGGGDVREKTLENAARLELSVHQLLTESDVDVEADLIHWDNAREANRLSIIVPVLNEAPRLGALLEALQPIRNAEIIVVDGDSEDTTVQVAREFGVTVISAPRGRARQMNAGAAVASGELLLFLHADSRPPRGIEHWVRRTLAFQDVFAGAFQLRIDAPGRAFRFLEYTANLRSTWLGTPYGDQALFLRRADFDALGGYPEVPILEDYALVREAKKHGAIVTLPACNTVSARRWRAEGILKLTLKNIVTFFAFPLGVSPARIARWYGR